MYERGSKLATIGINISDNILRISFHRFFSVLVLEMLRNASMNIGLRIYSIRFKTVFSLFAVILALFTTINNINRTEETALMCISSTAERLNKIIDTLRFAKYSFLNGMKGVVLYALLSRFWFCLNNVFSPIYAFFFIYPITMESRSCWIARNTFRLFASSRPDWHQPFCALFSYIMSEYLVICNDHLSERGLELNEYWIPQFSA